MAKVVKQQKTTRPLAKKTTPAKPKNAARVAKAKKPAVSKAPADLNFNQLLKEANSAAIKQTEFLKKSLLDLKTKLAKAAAKQKTQKDKRVTLAAKLKTKASAASKNQLNNVKAEYTETTALIASLKAEFEATKKALQVAQTEQAKSNALQKLLVSFEKDWHATQNKTTKPAAAPVTPKAAAKKTTTAAATTSKSKKSAPSSKTATPAPLQAAAPRKKDASPLTSVPALAQPQPEATKATTPSTEQKVLA